MEKKINILIPDDYDIHAPMSQADFSKMFGVQRSTVSRNIKARTIKTTADGKIIIAKNALYLMERFHRITEYILPEQKARYKKLLDAIRPGATPAPSPSPAPPIKPYSVKSIEPEVFYYIGIFQDEEFSPLCKLYLSEKNSGIELQPITDCIFQMDGKGNLSEIFIDPDTPAGVLFCQEID